jgi:hypothetical protein
MRKYNDMLYRLRPHARDLWHPNCRSISSRRDFTYGYYWYAWYDVSIVLDILSTSLLFAVVVTRLLEHAQSSSRFKFVTWSSYLLRQLYNPVICSQYRRYGIMILFPFNHLDIASDIFVKYEHVCATAEAHENYIHTEQYMYNLTSKPFIHGLR